MSNLINFKFNDLIVRHILIKNLNFFVARDIAGLLKYKDVDQAIRQHCKNTKSYPVNLTGQVRSTKLIQEPDIWRLIIKSKLPEAERIERWIFEEVLPSIRKTGSYSISEISKPEKQANLISVSTEIMRKEFEALDYILNTIQFSENEKRVLTNKVLERINFPNCEIQPKRKAEPVFTLTQLLEEFRVLYSPHEINLKLKSFGILQKVGGNWFLENLDFGVNKSYDNYKNPKYYKSTFQELLNIVL